MTRPNPCDCEAPYDCDSRSGCVGMVVPAAPPPAYQRDDDTWDYGKTGSLDNPEYGR